MATADNSDTALGWQAPDFTLPGVDGKDYSMADYVDNKGVLVVFSCNHCPYAIAAWPILMKLHQEFGGDVPFIAINSNDASKYPDDSFENMKVKAEEWGLEFPYLYDQSQQVARSYHAQCTPDSFLFSIEDGTPQLFYRGRINDNWQEPDKVTKNDLQDAIQLLLDGKEPPSEQVPAMGCSIKWKV